MYYLFDLEFTLSYVTPYVVIHFGFDPECIPDRRVYRGCVILVHGRETLVDLIKLDMVDFDMILGMDWLHSCYASLDYRNRRVNFHFRNGKVVT